VAASEFHPPRRIEPSSPTASQSSASSQAPDQGLLEAILRETLLASEAQTPLEPAEREGLLDVARRHSGRELALEPVALELVQAVLRPVVPDSWADGRLWRSLTFQVATTVFEDPQCRRRLEALWSGLCSELP
jgi:hypothetical protein